jgi:uncharacterized integral membrane protein (TIGR00697 family)
MERKARNIFQVMLGFFLTNALIAEFIGVKIFSLEKTLGFNPLNINILGNEGLSFNLTAGALLWPFVFVLTDLVNEYFGKSGVRKITFIATGMIAYAFVMVFLAIHVIGSDFWMVNKSPQFTNGEVNMNDAFNAIFGQGQWIIVGSLIAFVIGQLIDAQVFHRLRLTFGKNVWVRAALSTLVSQLLDSFIVLYIAFGLGRGWDIKLVLAIATVNYIYKAIAAIAFTPFIIIAHRLIDNYLGKELSAKLIKNAEMDRVTK